MYGSWDIIRNGWMERQADGQKKWHIEVGAQLKNLIYNKNIICKNITKNALYKYKSQNNSLTLPHTSS